MIIALAPILLVMAMVLGIFYGIKSLISGKKDEASSSLFIVSGVKLVVSSFGTVQSWIKDMIALVRYDQSVDDSIRIFNEMGRPDSLQLIFGILFVGLGIYFFRYNKHRIYILNLNGYFSNRVEDSFRDLKLGRFEFKEREVDFSDTNKAEMTAARSDEIVSFLARNVTSFCKQSYGFQIGYTGTAHIPFVAVAGTHLKRMIIDQYYEFDKKITGRFKRLEKRKRGFPELKVFEDEGSFESCPKSAVIAVSTTTPITDSQLSQFNDSGVFRLYIENPKDNSIVNQNQLLSYRNIVIRTIEELSQKHPSVERVHLVCSTQSCLVLEIGKTIEDYRNIQVVVYHFDSQANPKYPWGLVINGSDKGMFIKS